MYAGTFKRKENGGMVSIPKMMRSDTYVILSLRGQTCFTSSEMYNRFKDSRYFSYFEFVEERKADKRHRLLLNVKNDVNLVGLGLCAIVELSTIQHTSI